MSPSIHGGVGVRSIDTGEVRVCAGGDPGGNYGTLCGTSLDDDMCEQVPVNPSARINCAQCKNVWRLAHQFKAKDFT